MTCKAVYCKKTCYNKDSPHICKSDLKNSIKIEIKDKIDVKYEKI